MYIEAAEGFRRAGWDVTTVGPPEIERAGSGGVGPAALRDYLRAGTFDVAEVEHHQLPFPRSDLPARTLIVARSVLMAHSVLAARLPAVPTLRGWARWALGDWRHADVRDAVCRADVTLATADLINVANTDDRDTLIRFGHDPDRVVVFPYGLFPERRAAFAPPIDPLNSPVVAFVGTFDTRKGMVEFHRIVAAVLRTHPAARFRLIGTAGLVRTVEGVLRFFPRSQRSHIDIIPKFEPADLPALLEGCSAGLFPSRVEGFGYGVLEMLAAGIPVFAYRVPGPPMMLPEEYLVTRGDGTALGTRVAALLADPEALWAARRWAYARAGDFDWENITRRTAERYSDELVRLRQA